MSRVCYSVVIPLMDEEDNVEILYRTVSETMSSLGDNYEIVLVDDGSADRTYEIIESFARQDNRVKVVKFRRNFGQSAAMAAGFEFAKGDVVITMDGDLQNDPKDIPRLLSKLEEGYDIVSGWRKNRQDKLLLRKIPSKIANWMIRKLTQVELHDTGCSLKVYRRAIIERISLYGELHRFIPALGRIAGARIGEMVVNHRSRRFGRSKYNLTRTFRVIMDLITLNMLLKYVQAPLYFFGRVGLLLNLAGLFTAGVVVVEFIKRGEPEQLNVLVALSFLLLASGFQFLLYGLVSNMVVKTAKAERREQTKFDTFFAR